LNRSTYTHLKKKWIARGGGYFLWLGPSAIFVKKTKAENEGLRPGGLQGSFPNISQQHLLHEENNWPYVPWNPGCLIGILAMVYQKFPHNWLV